MYQDPGQPPPLVSPATDRRSRRSQPFICRGSSSSSSSSSCFCSEYLSSVVRPYHTRTSWTLRHQTMTLACGPCPYRAPPCSFLARSTCVRWSRYALRSHRSHRRRGESSVGKAMSGSVGAALYTLTSEGACHNKPSGSDDKHVLVLPTCTTRCTTCF